MSLLVNQNALGSKCFGTGNFLEDALFNAINERFAEILFEQRGERKFGILFELESLKHKACAGKNK